MTTEEEFMQSDDTSTPTASRESALSPAAQRNRERRREARRYNREQDYKRAMRSVSGGHAGTDLTQEMMDAAQKADLITIPTPIWKVGAGVVMILFLLVACFYAVIGVASVFMGG